MNDHEIDDWLRNLREWHEPMARDFLVATLAHQRAKGMQLIIQHQDDQARNLAKAAIARAQDKVRRG